MFNLLIAIIIVAGLILAEVIWLKYVKNDKENISSDKIACEIDKLTREVIEIKSKISRHELALGVKVLKK